MDTSGMPLRKETSDAGGAGTAQAAGRKVDQAAEVRVLHLFRHALRTGSVHPLLHIVNRHRQGERS